MSAAEENPRITSESRTADRRADGFGRKLSRRAEETGKVRHLIQAAERACCLEEQTVNPFALPRFCGCCRDPLPVWRAVPAVRGSKLNINFRQMSRIEKDRERMPP